jgi:hypothetical protein
MRSLYFRLLFIPVAVVWQASMIAAVLYFDSSPSRWMPGAFAAAALLLPFIGYIAVFHGLPWLVKWPRFLRTGILTVSSIVATIVAYVALFVLGLLLQEQLHALRAWLRGS